MTDTFREIEDAIDTHILHELRLGDHIPTGFLDGFKNQGFQIRQFLGYRFDPVHLAHQGIDTTGREAHSSQIFGGDGHLLGAVGIQDTIEPLLLVLANDTDVMAIETETVFLGDVRQVVHAHHTSHGYLLLEQQLVEFLHGLLTTQETFRLRLDAQHLGDTHEEHAWERTERGDGQATHLDESEMRKEQTIGQAEDHGFREMDAIEAKQRRGGTIFAMSSRLMFNVQFKAMKIGKSLYFHLAPFVFIHVVFQCQLQRFGLRRPAIAHHRLIMTFVIDGIIHITNDGSFVIFQVLWNFLNLHTTVSMQ